MNKKLFWEVICSLGLIIFALILALVWVNGQIRGLTQIVHDQEIRIMGAEKQIPNVARYVNIVRELTDKGKDKLTASEIVEMARIILVECDEHSDIDLTPNKIFGAIERESGFNPKALSPAHAYGIMRPIQQTFEYHLPALGYAVFSEDLAYNPVVNLRVGIAEMVRLRREFGDWEKAMTAYFWGSRLTWMLLESKKRDFLPSLEYGRGVLKLAEQYKARGIL